MSAASPASVCDGCARRTWLLGRLAGHLDVQRARIVELLALDDSSLISAVGGEQAEDVHAELARVDVRALAAARDAAGVRAMCRCDSGYPEPLRALPSPPAVLHLAGGGPSRLSDCLERGVVAIVGMRRATAYGREAAGRVAGECARAGLVVVSGLALGVDASAHDGALLAGGPTIAVMPGGAESPYPTGNRRLHARVLRDGLAVSELGPGVSPRRWSFTARNRIIAGLSAITIVVQAREGSGALLTAACADDLGRILGAVPGQIGSPASHGPHQLLREGARLIAGAGDVLDAVYGAGAVRTTDRAPAPPDPPLDALLDAIADGESGADACTRAGLDADAGLGALAALELSGYIRRGPGGRYEVRG